MEPLVAIVDGIASTMLMLLVAHLPADGPSRNYLSYSPEQNFTVALVQDPLPDMVDLRTLGRVNPGRYQRSKPFHILNPYTSIYH